MSGLGLDACQLWARWSGMASVEMASTFQASVCILFPNSPLAKVNHKSNPNSRGAEIEGEILWPFVML